MGKGVGWGGTVGWGGIIGWRGIIGGVKILLGSGNWMVNILLGGL